MNPFSLPNNDSSLYSYREHQKVLKLESEREFRAIPIYDRSPEVKIPVLSEIKRNFLPSLSPSKPLRATFISNRENLDDLIHRKREILLVKKSIEYKKQNIEYLESTITEKEKGHKETLRHLEDQLIRVEKYEEGLKIEATKKAENTEMKIKERNSLQNYLAKITEEIERAQVEHERKLEVLRQYEIFKSFVEEIARQVSPSEDASTFITQADSVFKYPSQILETISVLESKNLFQVHQDQEAEQELELLRSKNQATEDAIMQKLETLNSASKALEKQKETLLSKMKGLSKEEVGDYMIEEKTLEEIHQKLSEFIEFIGIETYANISDLEMLEFIEIGLNEQVALKDSMDPEYVKKLEKEIDKRRRTEQIEKIKEKEMIKRAEVNELLQKRKNKVVKKIGRAPMMRSKIAEKAVEIEEERIPPEVLDRIEFLDEPAAISYSKTSHL